MPRSSVFLVVIAGLAALACGGGSSGGSGGLGDRLMQEALEKSVEAGNPGTDIEINGDGFTMKGADGLQGQFGGNVSLPAGFPKDVPIYDGAKLTLAVVQPGTAGSDSGFAVTFETADPGAKIVEWYKSKLTGYTVLAETNYEGAYSLVMSNDGGKHMVSVTATQTPGSPTMVMLGVTAGS